MAEEAAPQTGAPVGGQDPAQPTQQEAAPAAPAPQIGAGPWADDLRQAFTDPVQAAQVDQFLRGKVQPRMTQLEQQLAEQQQARQLLEAFDTDPNRAYIDLSRQLYGDEYANALTAQLYQSEQEQQYQPVQQQPQDPYAALPPEVRQIVEERQLAQQQAEYDRAKAEFLSSSPQYADIDSNLFDPFVGAADTWEQAVDMYRAWAAKYAEAHGATQQQQTEEQQTPPPTLGSQGGQVAAVPAVKQYGSLDEAIEDAFKTGQIGQVTPPPPTIR